MEENWEKQEVQNDGNWEFRPGGINRWLLIGRVALLLVAGLAFGYGYRQEIAVGHLTAQQSVANSTIDQLQGQLNTVTAKLNDLVAAQQTAQQTAEQAAEQKKAGRHGAPVADRRYKQLQAQLEEQQKQLKDTQDQVAKNRTDLETSLSSTKDELNGSIAKTHEELVVLQKRGERNYFEFDLTRSRQFQRFGPLTLELPGPGQVEFEIVTLPALLQHDQLLMRLGDGAVELVFRGAEAGLQVRPVLGDLILRVLQLLLLFLQLRLQLFVAPVRHRRPVSTGFLLLRCLFSGLLGGLLRRDQII